VFEVDDDAWTLAPAATEALTVLRQGDLEDKESVMTLYMHIYYSALRGLRAARFCDSKAPAVGEEAYS
jgi:hypothetical protein